MGRGTTRRSPSDLAPSLLGIPYFTIHFASLSMILFVIKKRIFAKYQPLNLCSLTKPSPSPAAPQISAQQEPTPPMVSPASPSPAGRSKTPAAARHTQRPGDGEEAPAGEEAPNTPPTGPETPTPAQRPGDSPANHGQPSRSPSRRPSPRNSSPGSVQRKQTETETERGREKGATTARTASAPQHIDAERPPDRSAPSPSRRLESLTPAAVPDSRQDSQRRRRRNSAFGEFAEPEHEKPEKTRENSSPSQRRPP